MFPSRRHDEEVTPYTYASLGKVRSRLHDETAMSQRVRRGIFQVSDDSFEGQATTRSYMYVVPSSWLMFAHRESLLHC